MTRKIVLSFIFLLAFTSVILAQKQLKPGDIIPNISLLSTSGSIYDLNSQKGVKGFILIFMTPTCDHCIAYEPRIVALDKKYKRSGFPLVAIGPYGDDPVKYPLDAMPEMKKLAKAKNFQFPYLSDDHFKYTWMLGIKVTPTAVVLQRKSNGYQIKYIGKIDDEKDYKKVPKRKFVEEVVDKLL